LNEVFLGNWGQQLVPKPKLRTFVRLFTLMPPGFTKGRLKSAEYSILNRQATGNDHGDRLQQKAQQAVPPTANDQVTDYLAQRAPVTATKKSASVR
jgi:hypothetical protein